MWKYNMGEEQSLEIRRQIEQRELDANPITSTT
jgi:hypothetical protein